MKRLIVSIGLFFLSLAFTQCRQNVSDSSDIIIINHQEKVLTGEDSEYFLSVTLLDSLIFLEHVYSWKNQQSSKIVIASQYGTGNICVSYDLGETFYLVYQSSKERWKGCVTTESGRHLLWDSVSLKICIFDDSWNLVNKVATGTYCWLGSWSIAEYNHVIIYGEYTCNVVDSLYVWRSDDDGDHWKRGFSQSSRGAKGNNIRHFHTAQPDPYFPGTWYLSSGDEQEECKIWKSEDDGISWINVTDPDPEGTDINKVHRYTAISFDENYLYWGTDDKMDGSSKFVRAERTEPLTVQVINTLGNLERCLIPTPDGLVFISERDAIVNGKLLDFTIHISPDEFNIEELYRISDNDSAKTAFSYSHSSIASDGDIFFSHFDGTLIFPGHLGMLLWKLYKK